MWPYGGPAMSSVLRESGIAIVASFWWESPPPGQQAELLPPAAARALLLRLRAYPGDVMRLRRMLSERLAAPARRMDDSEVLDEAARWLAQGKLRLAMLPR